MTAQDVLDLILAPWAWAVIATLVAIWSALSAHASKRISERAEKNALRGSQATIISGLLDAFSSLEMYEAMVLLREYTLKHPVPFTAKFKDDVKSEIGKPSAINSARRLVSTHFDKVWVMCRHGIFEDEQLRLCLTKGQVEFYREVIEPLECVLNMDYSREPFEFFGERYGVDQSPFIPLMESWEAEASGGSGKED